MYLWVCMKYAWLDQLVLPNKKYEKIDSPMHVLHIAQVHGSSTDASSNGQTWYNRGERHIPSNTRQEQLWQRSSKLALFWPTIQFHHLLCQGKLHKSEKRATSSGGKSCFTSSNPPHSHLLPFQKAVIKKTSGGCVTSSSGDFGSSYRPFEQLVLPAWRKRCEWQILQMDSEFTQRFFQIPTDSVLFPLSTYITGKVIRKIIEKRKWILIFPRFLHFLTKGFLATLAADLSQLGAWCQMPSWWILLSLTSKKFFLSK